MEEDDFPLTTGTTLYGDHEMTQLSIWVPKSKGGTYPRQPEPRYWIVYIHGGAWRDPRVDRNTFLPTIKTLVSSRCFPRIAGFASIDYRLSPHPDFPQSPNHQHDGARNARHPDHLLDVRLGIWHLLDNYITTHPTPRFIVVGHSAGATLAYQLLMGKEDQNASLTDLPSPLPSPPAAVIGISGIYELRDLNARHSGTYSSFITGAFGEDESRWNDAMPACSDRDFKDALTQPDGKQGLAYLAWSPEDTLIDEPEIDRMAAKLKTDGVSLKVFKDLTGDHDVVWQEGTQIARLVESALDDLDAVTPPVVPPKPKRDNWLVLELRWIKEWLQGRFSKR